MLVDESKSNILSISVQCEILKLPRSVYYEKRGYTISDIVILPHYRLRSRITLIS